MYQMFWEAAAFNQPLRSWYDDTNSRGVHAVVNMNYLFWKAAAFDQDLGWCVNDDVDLESAFFGTKCAAGCIFGSDCASLSCGVARGAVGTCAPSSAPTSLPSKIPTPKPTTSYPTLSLAPTGSPQPSTARPTGRPTYSARPTPRPSRGSSAPTSAATPVPTPKPQVAASGKNAACALRPGLALVAFLGLQ